MAETKQREKKARTPKSPFKGVLEQMAARRSMKIDLGMAGPLDVETEIVVNQDTGEAFGVQLKKLEKKSK